MEVIKIDIEPEIFLDKECLSCVHNESPCPFCNDIGFIPTDAGKAILELVKRYK